MTDELRERIEGLEQRVEVLENNSNTDEKGAENSLLDRYDTYVAEAVEGDERPDTLRLRRLYEEAGVRNKNKIKQRVRRLDRLGVWEN